jgi:hypothetical protein
LFHDVDNEIFSRKLLALVLIVRLAKNSSAQILPDLGACAKKGQSITVAP